MIKILTILITLLPTLVSGQHHMFYASSYVLTCYADTFDVGGSYTWTCPSGVDSITVMVTGGGGSGGSVRIGTHGSAGGGGGGYSECTFHVVSGNTYNVTVGSGGVCTLGNDGEDGGASSISDGGGTYVMAAGGVRGERLIGTPYCADGGIGGQAADGIVTGSNTLRYSGGTGGDGDCGNLCAGMWATSATHNGDGADGADWGSCSVGDGGSGIYAGHSGSGAYTESTEDYVGGAGLDGVIIISYCSLIRK